MRRRFRTHLTIVVAANLANPANLASARPQSKLANTETLASRDRGACFLLYEIGVGEVRRRPAATCRTRVAPQSTFKIPHAVAALDAGVTTENETIAYDGHPVDFASWRHDHTLATAIRDSVVWFFQEIARRLGMERERQYLRRFQYGNQDPSSGLTTFWLGGSLAISPEEQQQFLLKLYGPTFPASSAAVETVRRRLVQPPGRVVNALGEQPFAAPWPPDAIVSAKTGSGRTADGGQVRWLVGHVRRGSHAWVFVSNVVGGSDTPTTAAVELAARSLVETRVLR
jgi:beta-lactamase class D